MKKNRRSFLKAGLLTGGVAATGVPSLSIAGNVTQVSKPLSILVLGGTGFIGPHMVREALRRGHTVSLFNRGKTNDELFPDLETITGDRAGDLDGLQGRSFDAVIDNSGYVPRHVQLSARLLSPNIAYYLYISTVAVYAGFTGPNDESSPLAKLDDETIEEVTGETYGPLKALCEKRATDEIGADRLSIVRPTYICGPGDHTDRFTYYPVRTSKGGAMLWPGSPERQLQIIDVRDLASFVVDSVEQKTTGIYNAVTPPGEYSMGDLLEDCQAVTATTVQPVWASDQLLDEYELTEKFPIYAPANGEYARIFSTSNKRAYAAGLRNRPVRETVRDLMSWWKTLPAERIEAARFNMTPELESELIGKLQKS
jgi:2'-hydroxyisoflavone reductase